MLLLNADDIAVFYNYRRAGLSAVAELLEFCKFLVQQAMIALTFALE